MPRHSEYMDNKKNLYGEGSMLNEHLLKPNRDVLPAIKTNSAPKPPSTPKRCKTRTSHRITRITPSTDLHLVNQHPVLPQVRYFITVTVSVRPVK